MASQVFICAASKGYLQAQVSSCRANTIMLHLSFPYLAENHLINARLLPTTTNKQEQFPIIQRKDEERYGEYRIRRLVLAAWDQFCV